MFLSFISSMAVAVFFIEFKNATIMIKYALSFPFGQFSLSVKILWFSWNVLIAVAEPVDIMNHL